MAKMMGESIESDLMDVIQDGVVCKSERHFPTRLLMVPLYSCCSTLLAGLTPAFGRESTPLLDRKALAPEITLTSLSSLRTSWECRLLSCVLLKMFSTFTTQCEWLRGR